MKWHDLLTMMPRQRAAAPDVVGSGAVRVSPSAADIPAMPVHQLLFDAAMKYGTSRAVDFLGKTYTYRDVEEQVRRAAKGFQRLGVKKGVNVGLFLPNSPYYVICYFAILRAGGTVVNFNPLYAEQEIARQIEDSGTTIMVTLDLDMLYAKIAAQLAGTCLHKIVVCPMQGILPGLKSALFGLFKRRELARIPQDVDHLWFDALINNDGAPVPVDVDPKRDVAVLQYTGGTTGIPKGAMLTHANLTANVFQIQAIVHNMDEGAEVILGVLPLFHVFAMTVILNYGVSIGAELILLPRFELKQVLKTIHKRRPTAFPGVPTIYTAINHYPKIAKYDLTSLKMCISGGAPLPVDTKRTFEEVTGCVLVEGYGLTEASPVVTCNPLEGENPEGSIGVAVPGTVIEFRSLENPRKTMPDGEKGELCVSGPQVMPGYWKRPQETAEALSGGVLHTGDVGYRDADGFVFIVDRIKDMILCSGFNVYPRAIEEAINLHPGVAEVTVIGVADDYRGQTPKAFIKLRDGVSLDEAELKEFLKDKLSAIEMPKHFEFRDDLPKTMIGKLSKKELVAEEDGKAANGEQHPPVPEATPRETRHG
jgi:long-chain acyl-CoA synthetase